MVYKQIVASLQLVVTSYTLQSMLYYFYTTEWAKRAESNSAGPAVQTGQFVLDLADIDRLVQAKLDYSCALLTCWCMAF